MTALEATFHQLPQPILDKLQLLIRRVRRLLFVRGIFATLAVALVCLLAIMALDATITIFSGALRWTLSLGGLTITAVAAWWFLVRPLSRKITLTHIARILEIKHPELQERISTAVELMSSDDPDSIRGSEELIEAVVDSAVVDVELVDPKTEFQPARAKKFINATGICLALLLILLAIWPKQSWTLLSRALAPFLDIGNAYADTMVIDPGDVRVARGEPVTIFMTIDHKRLRRAEVRRRLANGTDSVERMTLMGRTDKGHRRFSLTFPKVDESFAYRVRAGSAVSEYFKVEAVPKPAVQQLQLHFDYPEYTGKKPDEAISKTGEIRALANTVVTLTATVNKPVWSAKMLFNEHQELGQAVMDGKRITWTFPLKPRMNGTWQLDLTDEDGFRNADTSYPIQALPDKAPTVQIVSPTVRELRLKPTEVLPIKYQAVEDFGLHQIDLLVTPDGEVAPKEITQPPPESDGKPGVWRGMATLKIAALQLKPQQNRLTVQVRARDNRPEDLNGPGEGSSETITVFLDKKAPSLAEQAIAEDKKNLEQTLRETRVELKQALDEIKNTEREMERKEEFPDQARNTLKEFNKHNKAAETKLRKASEQLDEGVFRKQADALRAIAKEEVAKAREAADLIPVSDQKEQRIAKAKEAGAQVQEAISKLDTVEKSVRESESDRNMITGLNNLANDQRAIAQEAARRALENAKKMAETQPKPDQKQLKEFLAKQRKVQKNLGEILRDNAAALAEILEQQKQESKELSRQAGELAQEQRELKEINQQSTGQPQKGEELKKQLIAQLQKMQKGIAEETRQQAEKKQQAEEKKGKAGPQEPSRAGQQTQAENSAEPNLSKNGATPLENAKKQTEAASDNLQSETLSRALKEAQAAAKSLNQAADHSGTNPPGKEAPENPSKPDDSPQSMKQAKNDQESRDATPGREKASEDQARTWPSQKENARELSDLADRQESVAGQIAALEAGNLQAALALMEKQLSHKSESLETRAEEIEDSLENLRQTNAKGKADQAGKALSRAGQGADSAARQFDQAQKTQQQEQNQGKAQPGELGRAAQQAMQRGQPTQQLTENFLKQAARAMAQSADAIGQRMKGLDPSDMDDRVVNSKDLAKSFEDVSASSQSQDAQEAADQSQQAAQSLEQLAQAAMEQLGNLRQTPADSQTPQEQGMQSANTTEHLNESGQKTADTNGDGIPPELKKLGISVEDWTRFKGALTGGSATAIESDLPQEYRELVGRYFQVIAKEAGK